MIDMREALVAAMAVDVKANIDADLSGPPSESECVVVSSGADPSGADPSECAMIISDDEGTVEPSSLYLSDAEMVTFYKAFIGSTIPRAPSAKFPKSQRTPQRARNHWRPP